MYRVDTEEIQTKCQRLANRRLDLQPFCITQGADPKLSSIMISLRFPSKRFHSGASKVKGTETDAASSLNLSRSRELKETRPTLRQICLGEISSNKSGGRERQEVSDPGRKHCVGCVTAVPNWRRGFDVEERDNAAYAITCMHGCMHGKGRLLHRCN